MWGACMPADIWILATTISSVGHSISSETFDIENFDIECVFDIDVLHLRYRTSVSKGFDIEGLIIRYRRSQTFDIEGHEQGCRYRGFMPSISNRHPSISYTDIVYDIEGHIVTRYRSSTASDIVINIGHDIGLQTVLPRG